MNIRSQKYAAASVALEQLSDNLDSEDESDYESTGIQVADFETAVAATGYGKFNYLLLLGLFLPCWASIFDVSNLSMILPSAECDLSLSLFHKGILNAITYAGTISTAMLWGFLADVYGRKKLLIYGFLADSLCNMMSGLSQNFWVLLFFKFASGCIFNGPYAITMCYSAEFHDSKHRGRVMLFMGLFSAIGNIAVPLLAWSIIPQTWKIVLFDGLFVYNSWRLYLSLCGLPTMIGLIALTFFPESPKFLMTQGHNAEALKIFRKMYTMNTGKPADNYPVLSLQKENRVHDSKKSLSSIGVESGGNFRMILRGLGQGLKQMKPLFHMPHFLRLLLVVSIQFGGMLALNTIRLWLPQLFTILESFTHSEYDEALGPPTFCEILDISIMKSSNVTAANETNLEVSHCENIVVNKSVYINIILICSVASVGLVFLSFLVNIIGKKNLLFICYSVPMVCVVALNFSSDIVLTLLLSCLYVMLTNVTVNLVIAVTVDLFPTTLRTMSVSLIMMSGRLGSLAGNLLFPILLPLGCLAPIMAIAGFLLMCVILTIFIPKPVGGLK